MFRRAGWVALAVALVLAACGDDDDGDVESGAPGDDPDGPAWIHHGHVEGLLPDNVAASAIEDADALAQAWEDHAFEGAPPEVDFDSNVVLLIGHAGDGCVDELAGVDVIDGRLHLQWDRPDDMMCTQQLVFRIHAVEARRDHLPGEFTYGLDQPFEGELEPVTIDVSP